MKPHYFSILLFFVLFFSSISPALAAYCKDMGIYADTIISSNINLKELGYPQSINMSIADTENELSLVGNYEIKIIGGSAWQWLPGSSQEGSFGVSSSNTIPGSSGNTQSFSFEIDNTAGAFGNNHTNHHAYLFDKRTGREICYLGEYYTKPVEESPISSSLEVSSGCGVVNTYGTDTATCKISGQDRKSGFAVCSPPPEGTISSNNVTCCASQSRCDNLLSEFEEETVLACGTMIPIGTPSVCPSHCGKSQWQGNTGCCGTLEGTECKYVPDENQASVEIACGEFLPTDRNAHCSPTCPGLPNTNVNKMCCGFPTDSRCLPKKPTTASEYGPLVRNCGIITESTGIVGRDTCQIQSSTLEMGDFTRCSLTLRCCFTRDQCNFFDPVDNRCNNVTVNTGRGCASGEICTQDASNYLCKSILDNNETTPPGQIDEEGGTGGSTEDPKDTTLLDVNKGPTNETFNALNPLNIAAGRPGESARSPYFAALQTPGGIISRVLLFAFPIAGMILFIMIVWGGFEMVTGATNAKSMDAGKQRITAAIIGFVLLFVSYWLMQIIEVVFGLAIL